MFYSGHTDERQLDPLPSLPLCEKKQTCLNSRLWNLFFIFITWDVSGLVYLECWCLTANDFLLQPTMLSLGERSPTGELALMRSLSERDEGDTGVERQGLALVPFCYLHKENRKERQSDRKNLRWCCSYGNPETRISPYGAEASSHVLRVTVVWIL